MRSIIRIAVAIALVSVSATAVAIEFPEATRIDVSGGRGIAGGEVGTAYEAFRFSVDGRTTVTLEVKVTEVMEGTNYEDDDSVLYLMDEESYLFAEDDDSGEGFASKIENVTLDPGTYYAVVVTYGNEVSTGTGDQVTGFSNDGESRFRFDLVVETSGGGSPGLDGLNEVVDMGVVRDREVASGEAGVEHAAFSFVAHSSAMYAKIEVDVTRVLQGTDYEDDDSILYLFADDGTLVTENDDYGDSLISYLDVELPYTGRYYVAVATFGDEAQLDGDDRLKGYQNNGKSRFQFDLVVDVY